jgi:hypothetical protein
MTTIELYKEHLRILELCENTNIDPRTCIRYCGKKWSEEP